MTLDTDIAAGEPTEAARNLIDQAQGGLVELAMVTALELCWLGGPASPLFDERPANAWARLGRQQRRQVTDQLTQGLVRRRLLTNTTPRTHPEQPIETCALKPELGLVLAARCRPAFAVIVQPEDHNQRALRLFAVGDEADSALGFVLEASGLPLDGGRHFARVGKPGPLDWFYRYFLISGDMAADVLAQWTVAASSGWLVSAWRPDREIPAGDRLRIRGDGTRACLDGRHQGAPAQYDAEGLRAVMLDFLTRTHRPGEASGPDGARRGLRTGPGGSGRRAGGSRSCPGSGPGGS